jgi:hypothetical protein
MESANGGVRFCAPNQTRAYSDRIPKSEWDIHRDLVVEMHSLRYTKAEILDTLRFKGFLPSLKQLRKRMKQWDLQTGASGPRPPPHWMTHPTVEEHKAATEEKDDLLMNIDIEMDIPCELHQEPFAEGPTSWASYATHSLPDYDQSTTRMTLDAQSDQASVISRQTFVTHSSDSKSLKLFRHVSRTANEISKMDQHNRSHSAAKAGPLADSGRQCKKNIIRVRHHGRYQCHLCKHVSARPTHIHAICDRCSHQRCDNCLQWPRASQPSGEKENDGLGINTDYPMIEEEGAEGDIEAIFGIDVAKGTGLWGGSQCDGNDDCGDI